MLQDLKFQLSTAILTMVTIAAVVAAALNYQQLHRFPLPDDGVMWRDRGGRVVAVRVTPEGPAHKAGIRENDLLETIQGAAITTTEDVPKRLAYYGAWAKALYVVRRAGVADVRATVIIGEAPRGVAYAYQYLVGACYLLIGLFIYFRRGSANKARHFYMFCLASFAFCCFHFTGKLNTFDQVMYWGNVLAGWLAPALFLHFALIFPEPRPWYKRSLGLAVYLPGILFTLFAVGLGMGVIATDWPPMDVRDMLDRSWMALLTSTYVASGIVLQASYLHAEDTVVRQQLKWLRNGILFGFAPFGLLYAIPYVLGLQFSPYLNYVVVTLPLIPLTIAYSIVRYRLMDVDVIFRRGFAYTLATLVILTAFYALVITIGSTIQKNFKDVSNIQLIVIMLIATFLFQPLRNWIQEHLDRYFYSDRYDYRRTLVEFARELNAESELGGMLQSVADRLMQTLSIRHVAFFLSDDASGAPVPEPEGGQPAKWAMRCSIGAGARPINDSSTLDLRFLNWPRATPYLFFERTRNQLDIVSESWDASIRQSIADLDLNYYIPCCARGRTIAYLGASRTEVGEFLSSDDVELLQTLSNYVGIAIENANLYQSLRQKAGEYERLKEFSENIVESINVGILAAGLDDRVESWNTQMERLSGIGREDAVGRTLSELMPANLVEQLDRVQGEMRIHHLDKFPLDTAGGEATYNIAIAPLVSRDMDRIGRLVIFDDVTDRAELERRLVQSDKLSSIGLLAAGVAHEVNTPLAVISTYAQMLSKQLGEDDQKARMLDKISKQTFRASEIVNSLLNFSRTSTADLSPVQINRVIQETVSLLEHQFRKSSIEVRLKLDPRVEAVNGNAGKLQQVFLNLFMNARDAMELMVESQTSASHSAGSQTWAPPRSILEIATRMGENGIEVDVTDTGNGIAPEHLSRIYDPFFTTKSAKKGTGLGLSVTYGIVQEHHGMIEAVSKPGEGTCFHLEFPPIATPVPTAAAKA